MGKRLQKCIFSPSKAKNTHEDILHIERHCFKKDFGV
jgi:hypothetical protein